MYGCIESKSMWVRGCDMRSLLILSHSSLWSIDSPSNTCSPISVSVISIVSRVPSLFVSPFYCSIPSPSPSYRAPPPPPLPSHPSHLLVTTTSHTCQLLNPKSAAVQQLLWSVSVPWLTFAFTVLHLKVTPLFHIRCSSESLCMSPSFPLFSSI